MTRTRVREREGQCVQHKKKMQQTKREKHPYKRPNERNELAKRLKKIQIR